MVYYLCWCSGTAKAEKLFELIGLQTSTAVAIPIAIGTTGGFSSKGFSNFLNR